MSESKQKHLEYQTSYFNSHHHFFKQEIPDEVVERTREITAAAGLAPGKRVLDVGTGMGVLIPHFQLFGVKASDIVGCDLSQEMLAEAKRRNPEVSFWEGDFAQLPGDFGTFDAVFFNACFGNLFSQQEAVGNAAQRLNPRGRIVISHPMGNSFVRQLQDQDPQLVLSLLPTEQTLREWAQALSLTLLRFCDESELYIAVLEK